MGTETLSLAFRQAKMVDLSHAYEERMPNSPNHSKFFHNLWGSYRLGDRSLTYQLLMNEHSGTHVDAPAHFITDAKPHAHVTIDQVPLNRLVGRGVRIDCRNFREGDYVPQRFVATWEAEHDALREGDIVLFDFGWSAHWGLRPDNLRYIQDWPGISMETAEYLISKSIAAIGVDTLSPDPPEAHRRQLAIHPVVLERQVLIVENLTNLRQLPDFFLFLAFPLKIRDGSGSPIRAVALV
jgi:kynurenine formamidase